MPAPSSSSRAARRATAAPSTGIPDASHASRAAARAKVLPVPARPHTTAIASAPSVRRWTIRACSAARTPRRASTRSTTAPGTTLRSLRACSALSSTRRSVANSSLVVKRRSACATGTGRPSRRRHDPSTAGPTSSPTSATTAGDRRTWFANRSSAAASTVMPTGSRSHNAEMTSWRAKHSTGEAEPRGAGSGPPAGFLPRVGVVLRRRARRRARARPRGSSPPGRQTAWRSRAPR
jgi:hypothetical protein